MSRIEQISSTADSYEFPLLSHAQSEEPPQAALLHLAENESGQLELAPVDALTRMPLPILPPREIPTSGNHLIADWHHHYHPGSSSLLTSQNGLAVRHVRLQLLPRKTHHDPYHRMFEGPEYLPRTNDQRFGHIILACAGYVPAYAIDVHSEDPKVPVAMTKTMRRRLQNGGELQVRGQSNISTFIKNHLVRQDFSHVSEATIDEFLYTKDGDRKVHLGHWLLAIASEIAVEPVKPIYRQALEEGLIREPKSKLPNLAKNHVNGRKTSRKAIKALHNRLSKDRK